MLKMTLARQNLFSVKIMVLNIIYLYQIKLKNLPFSLNDIETTLYLVK